MDKPTALVTGGAGYIGSHVCKALGRAGYQPIVYDNLRYGHEWAVKWGPLVEGDILDRARLDEVFATYTPEAVIHFAAYAYVGESVADPGKYYRNNFVGSLTLLEAMRDHGVDKIVFSSSCATYGVPDNLPIREKTPQSPINPYGASKAMVERLLSDFGVAHALKAIVLRYFNAAGADPENEIGEFHNPETHLVPLLLDAASGRRKSITVFGTDYPNSRRDRCPRLHPCIRLGGGPHQSPPCAVGRLPVLCLQSRQRPWILGQGSHRRRRACDRPDCAGRIWRSTAGRSRRSHQRRLEGAR